MQFSRKCFSSKDVNLKLGTLRGILLDEKCFWTSIHDDIALLIQVSLLYFLVFALLTFKNPFKEQDVSYLWESKKKVNQLLKTDGRSKLINLQIKG